MIDPNIVPTPGGDINIWGPKLNVLLGLMIQQLNNGSSTVTVTDNGDGGGTLN